MKIGVIVSGYVRLVAAACFARMGNDVVILVTAWKEFISSDFDRMIKLMNSNFFIYGRNQFNHNEMNSKGFNYFQIGVK